MAQPSYKWSDIEEVYNAVLVHGNVTAAARAFNPPISNKTAANQYEAAISRFGKPDVRKHHKAMAVAYDPDNPPECELTLKITHLNATAVAFSDAHWTSLRQPRSLAHEALLRAIPLVKPDILLSVGDLVDMGEPSRHDPLGWHKRVKVREEMDAAKQHLDDILGLAPKALRFWVRGNHDDRFDKYLALHSAMFEGVDGFDFAGHFSDWRMCHRLDLNDAVVMHRFNGGIHAGWNNAVKAGLSFISGDTHSLEVKPMVDMRGRRYGVQTGMLADPVWPCFGYTQGNTRLWTPGFAVLTWRNGVLMPPELCEIINGVAWFRGQELAGKPRIRVQAGRSA
jgi:hypothetical protein